MPETDRGCRSADMPSTSLQGVEQIFKTDRHSILKWIEARVEQLPNEVLSKGRVAILEVYAVWSFVYQRDNQGRRYLAETDHQLALRLGSQRSHLSVLLDMDSGGLPYCRIYSDLCHAGEAILPARTHRERWYNTLRS